MSSYKLPETLKIGGSVWSVENNEHVVYESERVCGLCDPSYKKLRISLDEDNVDVLLHELGHAFEYVLGYYDESKGDDDAERRNEQVAHAVRMYLMDNADEMIRLCKWLKSQQG